MNTAVQKIPLPLLFDSPERDLPLISPDGRYCAFLAPDGPHTTLWLAAQTSTTSRPLIRRPERPILSFQWAFTSKHLFFFQDDKGNEAWQLYVYDIEQDTCVNITPFPHVRVQEIKLSRHKPTTALLVLNKEDQTLYEVYRLDILSHQLTLIQRNPGNVKSWHADDLLRIRGKITYDADCAYHLYTRGTIYDEWVHRHSWNAETTFSSGIITHSASLNFSSDHRYMYITDASNSDTSTLIKIDTQTGEKTPMLSDPEYDIRTGPGLHDLILTNVPLESIIEDAAGSIGGYSYYRDRLRWHFFNPVTAQQFAPWLAKTDIDWWIVKSLGKNCFIIGTCSDVKPPMYYHFDAQTGKETLLCETKPALASYTFAHTKPISYQSRDGLTIHGYLTMPPGVKRAPMLLKIHGGPWARDIWTFQPDVQFLANRGYGVLQINYRGSTGYGKQFVNSGNQEWGRKMLDDLEDGHDWVCAQQLSWQGRIGIMGRSYGGYAVLAALTLRPHLFACGVAEVPATHIPSLLESMPSYWRAFLNNIYHRIGHPEHQREHLEKYSPALQTEHILAPVLLSHGLNDVRVVVQQTEMLLKELKAHQKEFTFLLFEDEGHKSTKPANIKRYMEAVEAFLEKNLPL